MLEVVFLGTSGSVPTTKRGMPAVSLKYESELMLWDCGEGTQRQLMNYHVGYGSINSIFITHPHLDHFLGLYGLLETRKLSSPCPGKMKVFLPFKVEDEYKERYSGFVEFRKMKKGVLYEGNGFQVSAFRVRHCRDSFGLVFKEDDRLKFYEKKAHSLGLKGKLFREISEKGKVKIKGKTVKLEEVTWTKPGRKIVYTGDCAPGKKTVEAAEKADLLIHEGTFGSSMAEEARARNHSTVVDAAETAKKAGAKRLAITHISPRYSDREEELISEALEVFAESEIAYDGMRIRL